MLETEKIKNIQLNNKSVCKPIPQPPSLRFVCNQHCCISSMKSTSVGIAGELRLRRDDDLAESSQRKLNANMNPYSPTDVPTTPALFDAKSVFRPQSTRFKFDRIAHEKYFQPDAIGAFLPCPGQDHPIIPTMNQSIRVDFQNDGHSCGTYHFIDDDSDIETKYRDETSVTEQGPTMKALYSHSPQSLSPSTSYASLSSARSSINDHESTLRRLGYSITKKIRDTPQGCLYEAIKFEGEGNGEGPTIVTIKTTLQKWHEQGLYVKDGWSVLTEESIVKEARILQHLTVDTTTSDYIARFIDYFQVDGSCYLITEHVGDRTLEEFIEMAFEHIHAGKLQVTEYRRIVKFLFWQIASISVQNGEFIESEGDSVSIHPDIRITIAGFGFAELFDLTKIQLFASTVRNGDELENMNYHPFSCTKFHLNTPHRAPQVWESVSYDARKSDTWDIGIILLKMATGRYPYQFTAMCEPTEDAGYRYLREGKLQEYLEMNDLSKYCSKALLSLLGGLLKVEEMDRFLARDVIQHRWLKGYYKKYRSNIEEKSMEQKKINESQRMKMEDFPFYDVNARKEMKKYDAERAVGNEMSNEAIYSSLNYRD